MADTRRSQQEPQNWVEEYELRRLDRRSFLKRAMALGLTAPAVSALLAACTDAGDTLEEQPDVDIGLPKVGGVLLEGYDRDVQRMDPITALWWDAASYPVCHEALFAQGPDGAFHTMLSESWDVSDDGLTWRFRIRDNLRFHSGAVCDAEAVAASFNVTIDPAGGGFIHTFFEAVESVSAEADNTVVIRMKHPFANFPSVANNGFSTVFNVETWQRLGGEYGVNEEDGTGPFILKEFLPGSHLEVERWDDYPGTVLSFIENKEVPYLDGVRWVVLTEPATRARELEAGNVHALHGPAWADIERLKGNPDLVVVENVEWGHYFMGVDHARSDLGFDDVQVRQAFSHAINRQAIVDSVLFGFGEPAYSIVPTADPYYDPNTVQYGTYDPERAAALLDEAGWVSGPGGIRQRNGQRLSFHIITETDEIEQLVAQAIQGALADVGVEMSFTPTETGQWWESMLSETPPDGYMFRQLWTNLIDGAMLWTKSEFAGGCCNFVNAKIPEIDEGYEEWRRAGNEQELAAASSKIQLAAAENLPIFPIVTPDNIWVHYKTVHGWTPLQPNLYPFYNDVWLET